MMMKTSLLLVTFVQIFHGAAVVAFQPSAVSRQQQPPMPAVTSTLFRPQQPHTTSFQRQASVIPMEHTVDVAAERVGSMMELHPWDRVCATVSSTTDQLNALRQKIAKSGVATAISYSFVSNIFTSVAVSLAWYGFSLQTGLSPISPGQWKPFLAWYGGFYAVNSLLKPIRFMVALGVVPYTERIMAALQSHFDSKKASVACSTALLLVTSGTMMASAIGVASLVSGVPIFPGAVV